MTNAHEVERFRLRQLLDMQTDMLAGVAHELNTPLNSIIGFAELLADRSVDVASKEHTEFTNHILAGGRHLAQLTKKLGDLTNLNAQRPWRAQPLNLQALLSDVASNLRMTFMRRRVELSCNVAQDLDVFYGDETGVKQIVYSMIWHAIAATPQGQHVQVFLQIDAKEGLRIEVRDPGAVSDESALGLELALLEQLVAPHGGSVSMNTQVTTGRSLCVVLPRES